MMRRTTGWVATFLICLVIALVMACSGNMGLTPAPVTVGGFAAVMAIATWDGPRSRRRRAGRGGGRGS